MPTTHSLPKGCEGAGKPFMEMLKRKYARLYIAIKNILCLPNYIDIERLEPKLYPVGADRVEFTPKPPLETRMGGSIWEILNDFLCTSIHCKGYSVYQVSYK